MDSKDFKGSSAPLMAQIARCVNQLTPIAGLKRIKHIDIVS